MHTALTHLVQLRVQAHNRNIPLQEPVRMDQPTVTQPQERDRWNQRYRMGTHGTSKPDPLLIEAFERYVEQLFPQAGMALDIAGGTGRHAIFLASKGWSVRLIDIAEAGIVNAQANAGSL